MKKYCKYCGEFEVTPDENFCPKCGTPFMEEETVTDVANNPLPSSGQPTTIQQDNRIHKGDKVTIGGDNFNAQNVDNRTVTNTSNTTINNINNIVINTFIIKYFFRVSRIFEFENIVILKNITILILFNIFI